MSAARTVLAFATMGVAFVGVAIGGRARAEVARKADLVVAAARTEAAVPTAVGAAQTPESGDGEVEVGTPWPSSDFENVPPPETKSKAPTRRDWTHATPLDIRGLPASCTARRMREWVRVTCNFDDTVASVSQLVGHAQGVSLRTLDDGKSAEMIFPVRRGDRRVLEIDRVAEASKYTVDFDLAVTVSVAWLDGSRAPILTAQ